MKLRIKPVNGHVLLQYVEPPSLYFNKDAGLWLSIPKNSGQKTQAQRATILAVADDIKDVCKVGDTVYVFLHCGEKIEQGKQSGADSEEMKASMKGEMKLVPADKLLCVATRAEDNEIDPAIIEAIDTEELSKITEIKPLTPKAKSDIITPY
jgi:hypothetical protein